MKHLQSLFQTFHSELVYSSLDPRPRAPLAPEVPPTGEDPDAIPPSPDGVARPPRRGLAGQEVECILQRLILDMRGTLRHNPE
ncbi:MAG TPA: hypothetical protein DCY12_02725 [Candidatus Atribacteria bacterium]|nr:hypothetical protein [Candidatus Atribacteria bacterium]